MGYVSENHWASEFDVDAVTALGWLINPELGYLDDFLNRYRIMERDLSREEVKRVVILWLADFASSVQ